MPDDRSLIRQVTYPKDDDVRAIAQQSYAAEIIHIIGRLRLSSEERQKQPPVLVYLLVGEPPEGINIDEVTTLPDWVAWHVPEWLIDYPVPAFRRGQESTSNQELLTSANMKRKDAAVLRIKETIQEMQTMGQKITVSGVAKRAKSSRNTVAEFIKGQCEHAQAERVMNS